MPRFGDLDASFGTLGNGKVITDFSGNSFDQALSVAIKPDGKIIVAGVTIVNGSRDFALAGYLSNGSLDASFGLNGKVITDFGNKDEAFSVAINKNTGKIIVAGYTTVNRKDDFALAGYLSNGSLDASFGLNGKVITDFGGYANSVAIDPSNNKIIVAGVKGGDFALAGYLSNGFVDASFGLNGKVITDLGSYDIAKSVAIKPDGKIIVAGFKGGVFALAGYLSNGFVDASFGTNGKVITDFGSYDEALSVAIKPDGKIIVAGLTYVNGFNFALAGYLSNGSLDASFGLNGKVITDFGGTVDVAISVAINPNGKIIVAGYTNSVNDSNDFALACYNSNGSLDASFGTLGTGLVITDFGGNIIDQANSVAINPNNGKIIVAGFTNKNGSSDFALAGYFGETTEVPITEVPITEVPITEVPITEVPISNICFPANTLISTNQGNIAIQYLDPKIHTIRNKKIQLITKTVTQDKYLVCFEKDSLDKNVPSEKTIITKNHGIFYKGKMIYAKEFINKFDNVKKIKYTGETLYNVLLKEHDKMMVNNLICETLHPENKMVELYKILSKLSVADQKQVIKEYNDYSIKNNIFSSKR
jgi:uncharacterized delta-60 repeat protein